VGNSLSGKTILIADDEPEILNILKEELEAEGADIITAGDGFSALDLITKNRFDVLVTDLHMPKVNGMQLVSFVKSQKLNSNSLVVMISGKYPEGALDKLVRLGVVDILTKPLEYKQLSEHIKKRLNARPMMELDYTDEIEQLVTNASRDMLQTYFQSIEKLETFVKADNLPNGTAYGILPLFGEQVYGTVAIGMDDNFLEGLASEIFGPDASNMGRDTLVEMAGEMINQIGGQVKRHFASMKISMNIGLPLMLNAPTNIPRLVPSQTFCIKYRAGAARCTIEASFGTLNMRASTEDWSPFKTKIKP
jgi:CheY-like chemotaxis protein